MVGSIGLGLLLITLVVPAAFGQRLDPVGAPGNAQGQPDCDRVTLCNTTFTLLNGEAWAGGTEYWFTDFNTSTLILYDVATCQVLKTCTAPGGQSPSENTMLNGILYHYDFSTGLLYAIDPATCQVIATCDPPGDDSAEGLTSDGTFLWKGDSSTLYQFTPPTAGGGGCQVVATCPNPAGDSADGLTMCGGNLVMLGYSGNLYEIKTADCEVIGRCQLNLGASGNGLASNRFDTVIADAAGGPIDRVKEGCNIPVPVEPRTWGGIKSIFE